MIFEIIGGVKFIVLIVVLCHCRGNPDNVILTSESSVPTVLIESSIERASINEITPLSLNQSVLKEKITEITSANIIKPISGNIIQTSDATESTTTINVIETSSPDSCESSSIEVTQMLSNNTQHVSKMQVTKANQYPLAVEALTGIGIRLQVLLKESQGNFLVSPLSIAVGVSELMLGARGKLQAYLADLLLLEGSSLITSNDDTPLLELHLQLSQLLRNLTQTRDFYILETGSALFLEPGIEIQPKYAKQISEIYNTDIVPVNFSSDSIGAFKLINEWGKQQTHGRIQEILPAPLTSSSVAVLANAVYFRGDWETPFSYELSTDDVFHVMANKTVEATYLRGQLDLQYVNSDKFNCTMIQLPYKNQTMSMFLILPNPNNGIEYDLKRFSEGLQTNDIYQLINATKLRSVRVMLPKINLSNTLSLIEPLKRYKQYKKKLEKPRSMQKVNNDHFINKHDIIDKKVEAFIKEAEKNGNLSSKGSLRDTYLDLSGMSKDPRFKLTDIVQQMSLAINEKGTEATAIVASAVNLSGGVRNFFATRPFLFFIRHETTGATLFWGTIINPAA